MDYKDIICELGIDSWVPGRVDGALEEYLEAGNLLYFPKLAFDTGERALLSTDWSNGKAKNISLRDPAGPLRGAQGAPEDLARLQAMIARFAAGAETLVHGLFPHYRGHLRRGFASYRPLLVEGRQTPWRKDDTRLHVDSFPSNPTGGARLLRVFANINPEGKPRVWRVGEPFADFAGKFLPRTRRPAPGSAWLLHALGLTKSRRSDYDQLMGQLHDLAKADLDYQATAPQWTFPFPAGTAWVVYSDQVLHAAMSGQFLLEQTFYLDVARQCRPATSPLKTLERLAGRGLV